MESQVIHDSAPEFNIGSEIELFPSPLVPIEDLFQVVVNTPERSKNHALDEKPRSPLSTSPEVFKVVPDTPESVKDQLEQRTSTLSAKRPIVRKAGNLRAKSLKFDDPTGLLPIFLPNSLN